MKAYQHYRYPTGHGMYLLRLGGSLPTRTEKANEVACCLIREIIPRFGFPTSIGSESGLAF